MDLAFIGGQKGTQREPFLECPHCGEQVMYLKQRSEGVLPRKYLCPYCHKTYRIPFRCQAVQLGVGGLWLFGWTLAVLLLFPFQESVSRMPTPAKESWLGYMLVLGLVCWSAVWIAKGLGRKFAYTVPLRKAGKAGPLLRFWSAWIQSREPYLECPHCGEIALSLSERINIPSIRGPHTRRCPHCNKSYYAPKVLESVTGMVWIISSLFIYMKFLEPGVERLFRFLHLPPGLGLCLDFMFTMWGCMALTHLVGTYVAYTQPLDCYFSSTDNKKSDSGR